MHGGSFKRGHYDTVIPKRYKRYHEHLRLHQRRLQGVMNRLFHAENSFCELVLGSSSFKLQLTLYIITSKPAQEDIITVLQTAVCCLLTLTYCCVDIHRQSWTWGLKCGAVRLPGGAPAKSLQRRELWPGNFFCHCRHRFHTRWEPAKSDRCFARTQRTTTLEKLRPNVPESELKSNSLDVQGWIYINLSLVWIPKVCTVWYMYLILI